MAPNSIYGLITCIILCIIASFFSLQEQGFPLCRLFSRLIQAMENWLYPPYLHVLLNLVILVIVASSGLLNPAKQDLLEGASKKKTECTEKKLVKEDQKKPCFRHILLENTTSEAQILGLQVVGIGESGQTCIDRDSAIVQMELRIDGEPESEQSLHDDATFDAFIRNFYQKLKLQDRNVSG